MALAGAVAAAVLGAALAALLQLVSLEAGCSSLLALEAMEASPYTPEGRAAIATATLAAAVYTSARLAGLLAALAAYTCRPGSRCAATWLAGLYVPRAAGALIYIGAMYASPGFFAANQLALALAVAVLRFFGDIYSAGLAANSSPRLQPPRPGLLLRGAALLVAASAWGYAAEWLLGRLQPLAVRVAACGDLELTVAHLVSGLFYMLAGLYFARLLGAGVRRSAGGRLHRRLG